MGAPPSMHAFCTNTFRKYVTELDSFNHFLSSQSVQRCENHSCRLRAPSICRSCGSGILQSSFHCLGIFSMRTRIRMCCSPCHFQWSHMNREHARRTMTRTHPLTEMHETHTCTTNTKSVTSTWVSFITRRCENECTLPCVLRFLWAARRHSQQHTCTRITSHNTIGTQFAIV